MTSIMIIACALSAISGATLVVDANDLGPATAAAFEAVQGDALPLVTAHGKIAVPETGEYTAWAWMAAGTNNQVILAGQTLPVDVPQDEKQPGSYQWKQAGNVHLDQGDVEASFIALSTPAAMLEIKPLATLVLTTNANLKPEQLFADSRVYDQPKGAVDDRALHPRHTNSVFTFPEYTRPTWDAKRKELEKRVLLSCGLWPLPEKTPLNPVIRDEIDRGDYTVAKVYFEAYPGFLVTGNLYKPKGDGPFPGVVNPHGHWEKGRLENTDKCSVPGRAITLARMGMAAFTYDMIGYNDSMQFPHNWGGEREKLWGVHPFAMQLWSSIRAVDFLQSLPYVDKERIGATGASGGGTQTFALTAVEPRIKVSAPVNMISSTMQGGCLCENAPILRMTCSNMEIGAMMAPRPLMMVSATGDWTRETPRVEYPAIRSIYALYGVPERVQTVLVDESHNYNQQSREAVYRFFGKWLLRKNGFAKFTEPAFEVEPDEALRNFASKEDIAKWPTQDQLIQEAITRNQQKSAAQLAQLAKNKRQFQEEYQSALKIVLGVETPEANDLQPERLGREERAEYAVEHWVLHRKDVNDAVPLIFYRTKSAGPQDSVLLVHGEGKAALADAANGGPGPLIQALLAKGKAVVTIDTFLLGEHASPFAKATRHREGDFMDTFEPTDTGCRVQDVLTALAWMRSRRDLTETQAVAGLGEAGLWTILAAAADGHVERLAADLNGFDPDDDAAWVARYYIPCIRAMGGVPAALGLLDASASKSAQAVVFNAKEGLSSPIKDGITKVQTGGLEGEALVEVLS